MSDDDQPQMREAFITYALREGLVLATAFLAGLWIHLWLGNSLGNLVGALAGIAIGVTTQRWTWAPMAKVLDRSKS